MASGYRTKRGWGSFGYRMVSAWCGATLFRLSVVCLWSVCRLGKHERCASGLRDGGWPCSGIRSADGWRRAQGVVPSMNLFPCGPNCARPAPIASPLGFGARGSGLAWGLGISEGAGPWPADCCAGSAAAGVWLVVVGVVWLVRGRRSRLRAFGLWWWASCGLSAVCGRGCGRLACGGGRRVACSLVAAAGVWLVVVGVVWLVRGCGCGRLACRGGRRVACSWLRASNLGVVAGVVGRVAWQGVVWLVRGCVGVVAAVVGRVAWFGVVWLFCGCLALEP